MARIEGTSTTGVDGAGAVTSTGGEAGAEAVHDHDAAAADRPGIGRSSELAAAALRAKLEGAEVEAPKGSVAARGSKDDLTDIDFLSLNRQPLAPDLDMDAVVDPATGGIDPLHGPSAVSNLKAAGKSLFQAVLPDQAFKYSMKLFARNVDEDGAMAAIPAALGFIGGFVLGDVCVDLAIKPFFFVKDTVDAAVHGVLAGIGR